MKIRQGTLKDFELVYADMREQFPPSEMKSKKMFLEFIKSGDYDFCLLEKSGRAVGYFFMFIVRDTNIVLLDHFAIMEEFHSCGYGSEAFGLIKAKYKEDRLGMILEVEKINPLEPNTVRRAKFYKRAGAQKLEIEYLLPSYGELLPMDLYFVNLQNPEEKVSRLTIESTIKAMFDTIHTHFPNAKKAWEILKKNYSD